MHAHDVPTLVPEWASFLSLVPLLLLAGIVLFMAGLPIPVGYERGKIAWIQWCGTGMHAHVVYWWDDEQRFQTLHPADRGGEA